MTIIFHVKPENHYRFLDLQMTLEAIQDWDRRRQMVAILAAIRAFTWRLYQHFLHHFFSSSSKYSRREHSVTIA